LNCQYDSQYIYILQKPTWKKCERSTKMV
jgi:hypothetical protein